MWSEVQSPISGEISHIQTLIFSLEGISFCSNHVNLTWET
jgi:hypothetical protein